jgi:N utilization substance protein B
LSRRAARETALQVLFQIDVGKADPEAALKHMLEEFAIRGATAEYTRKLVHNTVCNLSEIDRTIRSLSPGWQPERMANVDRNIIRLAIQEILHEDDIPNPVAVNEAIELAKVFGTADSPRFVNGVLGNLVQSASNKQADKPLDDNNHPPEGNPGNPTTDAV